MSWDNIQFFNTGDGGENFEYIGGLTWADLRDWPGDIGSYSSFGVHDPNLAILERMWEKS